MSQPPFATRDDIQSRYPNEIGILAADETTRQINWTRVDEALIDASAEIRSILAARYTSAQISGADDDSAALLKIYAIDIALYRVSLSSGRTTDQIRERQDMVIKRLQAIASGKGALTFSSSAGADPAVASDGTSAQQILVQSDERMFTRERLGRI